MRCKITLAAIQAASAGAVLWDTTDAGFCARVHPGHVTFAVQKEVGSRHTGGRRRIHKATIGRLGPWTVDQARKRARQLLSAFDTAQPDTADPTLDEGRRIHVDRMVKRGCVKVSIDGHNRALDRYVPDLLPLRLSALTGSLLAKRIGEITDRHGKAVANTVLRAISASMRSAMVRYELPLRNIVAAVGLHKIARKNEPFDGRQGRMDLVTWWTRIWECRSAALRDINIAALLTGLRQKNVLQMRWRDVDLDRGLVHVPEPKGGRPFDAPLPAFLVRILRARQAAAAETDVYVFPGRSAGSYMTKSKAPGVPSLHRNRNTFASAAQSCRVDLYSIKVLMNHRVPADITSGYLSPDPDALRFHAERVAAYLTGWRGAPVGAYRRKLRRAALGPMVTDAFTPPRLLPPRARPSLHGEQQDIRRPMGAAASARPRGDPAPSRGA